MNDLILTQQSDRDEHTMSSSSKLTTAADADSGPSQPAVHSQHGFLGRTIEGPSECFGSHNNHVKVDDPEAPPRVPRSNAALYECPTWANINYASGSEDRQTAIHAAVYRHDRRDLLEQMEDDDFDNYTDHIVEAVLPVFSTLAHNPPSAEVDKEEVLPDVELDGCTPALTNDVDSISGSSIRSVPRTDMLDGHIVSDNIANHDAQTDSDYDADNSSDADEPLAKTGHLKRTNNYGHLSELVHSVPEPRGRARQSAMATTISIPVKFLQPLKPSVASTQHRRQTIANVPRLHPDHLDTPRSPTSHIFDRPGPPKAVNTSTVIDDAGEHDAVAQGESGDVWYLFDVDVLSFVLVFLAGMWVGLYA